MKFRAKPVGHGLPPADTMEVKKDSTEQEVEHPQDMSSLNETWRGVNALAL